MSPSSAEDSEWTTVHRGRRQRFHTTAPQHADAIAYRAVPQSGRGRRRGASSAKAEHDGSREVEHVVELIRDAQAALTATRWYEETCGLLKDAFARNSGSTAPAYLLCIGLGSPAVSYSSRHQVAALRAFAGALSASDAPLSAADPSFKEADAAVLSALQVAVAQPLSQCADVPQGRGLIFMPHCPRDVNDVVVKAVASRVPAERPVILANEVQGQGGLLARLAGSDQLVERRCPNAKTSSFEFAFNHLSVITIEGDAVLRDA